MTAVYGTHPYADGIIPLTPWLRAPAGVSSKSNWPVANWIAAVIARWNRSALLKWILLIRNASRFFQSNSRLWAGKLTSKKQCFLRVILITWHRGLTYIKKIVHAVRTHKDMYFDMTTRAGGPRVRTLEYGTELNTKESLWHSVQSVLAFHLTFLWQLIRPSLWHILGFLIWARRLQHLLLFDAFPSWKDLSFYNKFFLET